MFMMVATIAATATYKWLNSIGSSSAARLQLNEARTAAQSGIEATRSWMTFKGNDVGAVIKQYFDGGKKPILLNSVLPRFRSSKANDSLWLMGVDIDASSGYKLKVLSQGTTRENIKYSEVAIFVVNGLYQIDIPTIEPMVKYGDAFHGGIKAADELNVSSAFIKSSPDVVGPTGQLLNKISSTEYLVLDGDFYVNNTANVKDLYVTGDLSFGNNMIVAGNAYIGGTLYGTMSSSKMMVSGSTYLNEGMKVNDKSPFILNHNVPGFVGAVGGQFDFHGNVTSNGDIEHFKNKTGISHIVMHENLVLNGKLKFFDNVDGDPDYIQVLHNAFVRDNSTASGSIGFDYMNKISFGTSPTDKVYLSSFVPYTTNVVCTKSDFKCLVSNNDKIYVKYKGDFITTPSSDDIKYWNADSLPQYGEMITSEKLDKCGFSKDPIQFNMGILNSSFVLADDHRMKCSEEIWKNNRAFPVELLNDCYNMASADNQLYDKNWLVVKWSEAPKWSETSDKLNGNFIFIIDAVSTPQSKLELPETDADAKVML